MKSFFVAVALLGALMGVRSQTCGVIDHTDIVDVDPVDEGTAGFTRIAEFELYNVRFTSVMPGPHNGYLIDIRHLNNTFQMETTSTFANFVTVERSEEIRRQVRMNCDDFTFHDVTFVIPVIDKNDQPPTFSEENYEVNFQLSNGDTTHVSTSIFVSDKDVNPANADVHVTSSNRNFVAELVPLWEEGQIPSSYDWQVNFEVNNTVGEGVVTIFLTADDGAHIGTAIVNCIISGPGQEPTTSEPEETTTEAPVTDEPTTPEEEVTTEEPVPTTTQDPGDPCGLVGVDSKNPVHLDAPLDPLAPPDTELWRGVMFNVNTSTATWHAHNKYIDAYRAGFDYYFLASDSYPLFQQEQFTNVIYRQVNFYCNGQVDPVRYTFELEQTPLVRNH